MEAGQQTQASPSPAAAQAAGSGDDTFADRPELFVGGAFVGGVVIAQVIRLIGKRR